MNIHQQRNKKVTQLVIHIKQLFDEGKDYDKMVTNIQNQIDQKQNQIRELFARNIQSVTAHFLKYYQICNYQKKIQLLCQQFDRKIQKTQKLSQYDQKMIQRSQQMLQNMAKVKNKLLKYRDHIRLLKKTTMNLNQDKYNNAIKLYHKAKASQLAQLQKTPFVKCFPIFKQKIQQQLQKLINIFWDENSSKQIQVGIGCFNRILTNHKQKINIYQNFFGGKNNNRVSSIGRNSLFRNSFIRNSMLADSTKIDNNVTFFKTMSQDNDFLQKFIIRANVQMAPLKQAKLLCIQLESENQGVKTFQKLIKQNILRNLKKLHENRPCQNQQDYKLLLSHLIGFLLVCRQVTAHFNIDLDENLFVGQIYLILRKQIKSIIPSKSLKFQIKTNKNIVQVKNNQQNKQHSSSIIKIKQFSDIFYKILQILKISQNPRAYTLLLEELLKSYCSITIQKYEAFITNQSTNDNLILYKAQSSQQEQTINQIIYLNQQKSPMKGYNFTGFVPFIITIFNQFFEYILLLVKDTNCNKTLLHNQLAEIIERIVSLYGSQLIIKDHPLQIAQGQINLLYCVKIYKYYSNKLEVEYNYGRTSQPKFTQKLSQLIIQLRRRIRQLVQHKIQLMLSSYYSQPKNNYRQQHVGYVEWLMQYVKQTINYMKSISSRFVQQILFSVITYITYFYWQFLKDKKQYSLITIHNLDIDLSFIQKFIGKQLGDYQGISDKLKSLQQFYSLMLKNNITDITDPQKRALNYNNIDLLTLIIVLSRYNRINCPGLRDLKKRQVQSVIKKLQTQIS